MQAQNAGPPGIVLVRAAELDAFLLPHDRNLPEEPQTTHQASYPSQLDSNEPSPSSPLTEGPASARRLSYSLEALRGWFVLRVHSWPKETAYPTEADDLIAARATFEGEIPRRGFRTIRREKTPASWRKPGPRRARQC